MNASLLCSMDCHWASVSLSSPCAKGGRECQSLNQAVISRCMMFGSIVRVPSGSLRDVMSYGCDCVFVIEGITRLSLPCSLLFSRISIAVFIFIRYERRCDAFMSLSVCE